jgi:hypothetical protein
MFFKLTIFALYACVLLFETLPLFYYLLSFLANQLQKKQRYSSLQNQFTQGNKFFVFLQAELSKKVQILKQIERLDKLIFFSNVC